MVRAGCHSWTATCEARTAWCCLCSLMLRCPHVEATAAAKADLVRSGHTCSSPQRAFKSAARFASVDLCATECARTAGCRFFIYGAQGGNREGRCYFEKTSGHPQQCPEGWEEADYDFYELDAALVDVIGMPYIKAMHVHAS